MLDDFVVKLKNGYWLHGHTWKFDWYIHELFVEAIASEENPLPLHYDSAVIGDEFLDAQSIQFVKEKYKDFLQDSTSIDALLCKHKEILLKADELITTLESHKKLNLVLYKHIQLELSLLMASISIVLDPLLPSAVKKISESSDILETSIIAYIIDKSSNTKINESNKKLQEIYHEHKANIDSSNFNYEDLSQNVKDVLTNHARHYGWINTGERSAKSWDGRNFLEQVKNLTTLKKSTTKLMQFNAQDKLYIDKFIALNKNDNAAADKQVKLDYLFQIYLNENLGESYIEQIIENLTFKEIGSLLDRSESIDHYKNRFNNIKRVLWAEDGKVFSIYFDSEDEFRNIQTTIKSTIDSSPYIKGSVACLGLVKGKVRIIRSSDDLTRFQEGEILVASQTQPNYVVAMTKAKAIVTDIGGITSHAAIIAREFGIPCIVGTGNATTKLKDGDIVLVDAEKGEVFKT